MSIFSSSKKKKLKIRESLCHDVDIFIQVHYVRERSSERYKFNMLSLKDDPIRANCKEWYEKKGNPEKFSEIALLHLGEYKKDEKYLIEKYQLEKDFFSKLKNSPNYRPSKGEVVSLCIGFHLDIEFSRALLKSADYALTNSEKSDLIIRYFIENKVYSMGALNYVLTHFEQPVLKDLM